MEEISDIKIAGVDENRPPRIRKEPYIDLYFKLSHKAPLNWCKDFNDEMAKNHLTPKIKPEEGLYVETWVRTPDEIPAHLTLLQAKVAACTQRYLEKIRLAQAANASGASTTVTTEQSRLNKIIADLKYDNPQDAPH